MTNPNNEELEAFVARCRERLGQEFAEALKNEHRREDLLEGLFEEYKETLDPSNLPTLEQAEAELRSRFSTLKWHIQLVSRLLCEYYSKLVQSLRKKCENPEDSAQDAFVKLWQNRKLLMGDELNPPNVGQLRAWLYKVAVHSAISSHRKNKKEILGDLVNELNARDVPPSEIPCQAELGAAVESCIDGLPRGQRDVIKGLYIEGKMQMELVIELQIDKGNVSKRKKRGLASIKACLTKKGFNR